MRWVKVARGSVEEEEEEEGVAEDVEEDAVGWRVKFALVFLGTRAIGVWVTVDGSSSKENASDGALSSFPAANLSFSLSASKRLDRARLGG